MDKVEIVMRHIGWTVAILLLTGTVLAGCLDLEEDPRRQPPEPGPTLEPNETDDLTQPAAGNDRLFLHADGTGPGDAWMSTNANETATSLTHTFTPAGEAYERQFPLTPKPSRTMNLTGEPADACLQLSMSGLGDGPEPVVSLLVDGSEVGSAEGSASLHTGHLCFKLDTPESIAAGADVTLQVRMEPQPTTLSVQWELHLDGRSYLDLPIETPVYVDLNATSEDGGDSSRRADGDVVTFQKNGVWYAEKAVTFTGGTGHADALDVDLATGNGPIDVEPRTDATYRIVVALEGRGDSEQEALARLGEIRLDHDDDVDDGTMDLETRATTASGNWRNQSAAIDAEIPTQTTLQDFGVSTGNGAVSVADLTGASAHLDTGNGAVTLAGSTFDDATVSSGNGALTLESGGFGSLALDTGNGRIDVDGANAGDLDASTGNGRIVLDATPTGGSWSADTGNGDVEVRVPDTNTYGYDAQGDTGWGQVTIDLADAEPVGEQSQTEKHERTSGYDSRDVKTEITASTGNGDVDILGA